MSSCRHLKALFEMCHANGLRLSSSDLIRIVCPTCGVEEACPTILCEQYEASHPDAAGGSAADPAADPAAGDRPKGAE